MSCVVIHNIAGSSNSINSPFVDAAIKSKGQVEYHKIHKRQADPEQFRRCAGTIWTQQCTDDLIQERADLALQCGQFQVAQDLFNRCQKNPMGVYCGIATGHEITGEEDAILAACRGSICSSQCRNLLMNIRNELGCCINVILNDTSSRFYNPTVFRYSLWASCGVEPVPNDCMSTLIQRPTSIDPSCTPSDYIQRVGSIVCSTRFIEPILEALANENDCETYSQVVREQCGVNEAGVPCYEIRPTVASGFSRATSICTTTTRCSAGCRASLQDLRSSAGCCINNIFNGTALEIVNVSDPILTYEFWRRCGVTTPGICEAQFNSATTNMALNKLALILLPILMAVYF